MHTNGGRKPLIFSQANILMCFDNYDFHAFFLPWLVKTIEERTDHEFCQDDLWPGLKDKLQVYYSNQFLVL